MNRTAQFILAFLLAMAVFLAAGAARAADRGTSNWSTSAPELQVSDMSAYPNHVIQLEFNGTTAVTAGAADIFCDPGAGYGNATVGPATVIDLTKNATFSTANGLFCRKIKLVIDGATPAGTGFRFHWFGYR